MKNLLFILVCIISLTGIAQQTEQPPIIFEGVAVSATEFFIDSTGKANTNTSGEHGLQSVYTTNTSYLVHVTRVLKGQEYLDTGYVEVITKLSVDHLENRGKYENYIPNLYRGIFFSEINTVPVTLGRKTNNKVVLQPYHFKPMKIDFNRYDCFAVIPKGESFKTKEDLANYLKKEYNIDYLDKSEQNNSNSIEDDQPTTKKKSVLLNGGLVKKSKNYQKNLENYKQFISNSKYKKEHQNTLTSRSAHTLHLELANETMTDSANFRFFEFDILASDVDGGYFDKSEFDNLIQIEFITDSEWIIEKEFESE